MKTLIENKIKFDCHDAEEYAEDRSQRTIAQRVKDSWILPANWWRAIAMFNGHYYMGNINRLTRLTMGLALFLLFVWLYNYKFQIKKLWKLQLKKFEFNRVTYQVFL